MASKSHIKRACTAMKPLGIQEAKVRSVLKKLLKTYDNNWHFIEDEEYKVLLDAILDQDDAQATEKKKKEEIKESKDVATSREKKKYQTQLTVRDEEDDIDEDETPLRKRLCRKRERGCETNASLSLGSHTSNNPNEKDHKLAVKDETPLRKRLCRIRERGCEKNASLSLGSHTSKNPKDHMHSQPEEEDEDDEMTELPLLKRYLRRTGERGSAGTVYDNTSPSSSSLMSMEPEVLPSTILLPADPVVPKKDSVAGVLNIVNNELFIDLKPMIPDVIVLEMENIYVEQLDGETDVTLNDTTAMDVPPSETVSDMTKAGDESGGADISMGLVVVPECEISADGWRTISNRKDITLGRENIEIPWVNEINVEVPSRFCYIPHNFVFQEAAVKFSVSSFSDDQCCFSCIGDCLRSSSMPCDCTIAYTVDGVLKEDFLEERISEARDQRKQVLQFCKECPLEKAKKEEILEPCEGHIKRKAIKECWIKCGCAKICGNRVVQKGIHDKIEVFFTPNGKGWGLRTLERLPQGSFVCEYIGEILTIREVYERILVDELTSPVILDAHWGSEESLEDNKSLCLDGTRYGNISRFLNHRCLDANLIEIPVHVETPDQHYYHLAFFTTRDVEAMEELTWDYGIDFNDDESLMKPFDCLCGSRFCRNLKRSKKTKKKVMNRE